MLAVEKWAENKPFIIALCAPQLVVSTRDINIDFLHLRERRIFNHQFPLPPLSRWFTVYRSHRKPIKFLKTFISDFSGLEKETIKSGEAAIEGLSALSSGKIIKPEHPPTAEEMEQAKNSMQNILTESFLDLKRDFDKTPPIPAAKEEFLNMFSEGVLEGSFFLLVIAPCWLLYRTTPTRLYRKARLGDTDALEKLLRLDPLMLHDPTIGKQIQAFRFKNKNNVYQTLLEAPLKRPKGKFTRKKMKYAIAGLISALATSLKFELEEPDIRALFDAVAKDSEGKSIDTDIADSPEAFSKAIRRDRIYWLKMLNPNPDKKK